VAVECGERLGGPTEKIKAGVLEPVQDLAKRGIIVVIGGGKGMHNYPSDITRANSFKCLQR
jgi:hypothetical protein